ncbi:MAG TPA: hypothetical protein VKP67_11080 [Xanthobacteraceae bacterium]|nr:hypothetical protein [Xanthobacteraceae bacterium]
MSHSTQQVSARGRQSATNQTVQKGLGYRRVTTNFSGRAFDYCPPGVRDPDASDLDRVAAGSHDLALYRRAPGQAQGVFYSSL